MGVKVLVGSTFELARTSRIMLCIKSNSFTHKGCVMPAVATEAPSTVEYHAWFQCIAGCPAHYSLQDIIYRCPRCGEPAGGVP